MATFAFKNNFVVANAKMFRFAGMDFARIIRDELRRRNWTTYTLIRDYGIDRSAIYAYLSGKRKGIDSRTLAAILQALDIELKPAGADFDALRREFEEEKRKETRKIANQIYAEIVARLDNLTDPQLFKIAAGTWGPIESERLRIHNATCDRILATIEYRLRNVGR